MAAYLQFLNLTPDTRNLLYNTELMGRNTNEYNHTYIICNKKALTGDGSIMGCSTSGYGV